MEVVDFLAALGARVGQQTETAVRARIASVSQCNFRCKSHYSTQPAGIFVSDILEGHNMVLGYHQEMDGRSRLNIVEYHAIIVLMNDFGWNFSPNDFAENTVFAHDLRC